MLKSKTSAETYIALTALDARDWLTDEGGNTAAWRDLSFSVKMADFGAAIPAGEYDIYLKINDPKRIHY